MTLGPVFSLGVHILDVLGRPVTEIPPGQSSVLLEEIRATAAGTAAGTSVDLAHLGVEVYSCGAIGDDVLGDLVVTLLQEAGADTRYVVRKAAERTSATILPIRPNGERPALHAPGAAQRLEPEDLTADIFERAAPEARFALHIGGPDALGPFAGEPLRSIALAARQRGALVTMDLLRQGDAEELDRLRPLLPLCDWFMPNEDQLCRLTGQDDLYKAMAAARAAGAAGVVVTRGGDGCSLDWGEGILDIPAIAVEVVDTTGCGDGFDAGFITAVLLCCDPVEAAWLAAACGSLVATGLGSDAGITSLDDAVALLARANPEAAASIGARAAELAAASG